MTVTSTICSLEELLRRRPHNVRPCLEISQWGRFVFKSCTANLKAKTEKCKLVIASSLLHPTDQNHSGIDLSSNNGGQGQSGQAIKLFQTLFEKLVFLPFLTPVYNLWWCETLQSYLTAVLNERMWHFGVKTYSDPPTYFQGSRPPPTPLLRHIDI